MNEQHEHDWVEQTPDESGRPVTWRCRECVAVIPPCDTCARPNESANRVCVKCLDRARRVLADIDKASRTPFATSVLGVRAIRYDRGGGKGGRRVESLPFGLDAMLVDPDSAEELARRHQERPGRSTLELLRKPAGVLDALVPWADQWADRLGTSWAPIDEARAELKSARQELVDLNSEPAPGRDHEEAVAAVAARAKAALARCWSAETACARAEPTAANLLRWLEGHLVWAANNPDQSDWPVYLEEANTVRRRLRRLVGLAPEIEPAPCVECGGQVVRDWTPIDGLSDARRCTRCGMKWTDQPHLDFVNLTTLRALPRTRPDELVTADMAKAALPTSRRAQLRLVLHRDRKRLAEGKEPRLPIRGTDERGRALHRLGDVWIAADPDVGVTAAEAIAAIPPERRVHLRRLLAADVPDCISAPALLPRGRLSDGTAVYRLGTIAEAAASAPADEVVELRAMGSGTPVRVVEAGS